MSVHEPRLGQHVTHGVGGNETLGMNRRAGSAIEVGRTIDPNGIGAGVPTRPRRRHSSRYTGWRGRAGA